MGGDQVALALAGAGWIAAVHSIAIAQVPETTVTKVASRQRARAERLAGQAGAEACDYADLPGDADGVVVCTPPALHTSQALAAACAGAAVLVEKPLAATLADADLLVAAASAGATIAYAENLAFAPAVRLGLAHVAQLVDVDLLEVRTLGPRPDWGDFLTEGWGGGVLFDLGAHPVALALAMAAPARPVEVQATLGGADDHPVDEHAEVLLRFDTGLSARVIASWRQATPVWDAQVSCPDGVVRLELLPEVRLERSGVEVRLPDPPDGVVPQLHALGYFDQIRTFANDVADHRAGRATPEVDAAFGRSVLDVICGAYASAGAGSAWLPLPFQGHRHLTPLQLWRGPRVPSG